MCPRAIEGIARKIKKNRDKSEIKSRKIEIKVS